MLRKRLRLPIELFPVSAKTILKNEYFTIKSVPNRLGFNRVGVTFKSKAFKTAVLRNRLKRTVFDYFRYASSLQTTNHKLPTGRDLLIILNPLIIDLTKSEIINKLKNVSII